MLSRGWRSLALALDSAPYPADRSSHCVHTSEFEFRDHTVRGPEETGTEILDLWNSRGVLGKRDHIYDFSSGIAATGHHLRERKRGRLVLLKITPQIPSQTSRVKPACASKPTPQNRLDGDGRAEFGGKRRAGALCSGTRVGVLAKEHVARPLVPSVPYAPARWVNDARHGCLLHNDTRIRPPRAAEIEGPVSNVVASRSRYAAAVEDVVVWVRRGASPRC